MTNPYFTWSMAEELALGHMKALGFPDARRTPPGADGGIDVTSTQAIAQVKFYSAPVGIAEVQRLAGAAGRTKTAVFYSSSGYTASAAQWASESEVALFAYTTSNEVSPVNEAALRLDRSGSQEPDFAFLRDYSARKEARNDLSFDMIRWEASRERLNAYLAHLKPALEDDSPMFGAMLARAQAKEAFERVQTVWDVANDIITNLQSYDSSGLLTAHGRLKEALKRLQDQLVYLGLDLEDGLIPASAMESDGDMWSVR